MIFALEFNDNVDPTALATVALAVVTFATVVVGAVALHRTRSEIDLSRQEVEEAHRPVVVPVLDENRELREFDAPTVYRAKPRYLENSRMVLPIENIGSGPALNNTVFVRTFGEVDNEGKPREDRPPGWSNNRVLGLGTSEMMPITVLIPGATELPSFDLAMTYVDVAGKGWKTSAKYYGRAGGGYYDMSIEAVTSPDMVYGAPAEAHHKP